jgi:hypothetical protein
MSLPDGVTTCTVTYGKALGYRTDTQTQAKIEATLTADRSVVHAETGWSFNPANEPVKAATGGELTFAVPHVDQAGFVNTHGDAITNWAYTLAGNLIFPTKTISFSKTFQVFVGQTTLDLDLAPDGPAIPGVTAPNANVLAAQAARDAAAGSATAAAGSATSAATSASTATTKAGEAATSATAAGGSATSAAGSAAAAAGSATSASGSAATATEEAGEASTSASSAATSASTATTKAGEAATSATAAAGSASAAQTARTGAEAARTGAEAVGATNDTIIAGRVNDPASATAVALSATFEAGQTKVIYVSENGNDAWSGLLGSHAKKTLAAALTAMGTDTPGVIMCAPNVIDAGSSTSLNGYACSIIGLLYGYHETTGTMKGTVIKATAPQTGPVLDFTGWKAPGSARGQVEFGGFTIEGDNTADPTRAHKGIKFAGSAIYAHDIVAWKTGGAPIDFVSAQLSDFDRLLAITPVGAKVNDVAYMMGTGAANGNYLGRLRFRSTSGSGDVGVSGALVLKDDGTYAPLINTFDSAWFEFLHVPNGGCLISVKGSKNVFRDTQFFDCGKEAGATGTTYFRFADATVENQGGNVVQGYIPGAQAGSIDSGVELLQSNNVVEGVKGFNGNNVIWGPGVNRNTVIFHGCEATATAAGVVDNSGTQTNIVIDASVGLERHGDTQWERDSATGDLRISRTNGAAAGVQFGAGAGPRVFTNASATPTSLFMRADGLTLQAIDATLLAQFLKTSGPGFTAIAPAGQASISASGFIKITSGGLQRVLATKTSSYLMAYNTDDVIVANGASITITLPRADFAGAGRAYMIKNVNATSCTVATSNSNTIDGAASDTLAQWAAGRYVSDGTNWIKC